MALDSDPLPTQVRSAEAHIQEAGAHFTLLAHNFPEEALATIVPLHTASELLLRVSQGEKGATRKSVELINRCEVWTPHERQKMHWLRKQRNKAAHRGEIHWESSEEVTPTLREAFPLVGKLFLRLNYSIRDNFPPRDAALLLGAPIPWTALALTLADSSIEYAARDAEIAVDIANAAFEVGLRGFANSWEIPGANSLSLQELIDEMWQHPDENAHPHYWDERIYDDRDRYRDLGDSPDTTLRPPMRLPEIPSIGRRYKDLGLNASYYAQEIREIILSYLERYPALHLETCLRHCWNDVVHEMRGVAPDVQAPLTDEDHWNPHLHFFAGQMRIQIPDSSASFGVLEVKPSEIWSGEHLDTFRRLVEERCGPIPLDVSI